MIRIKRGNTAAKRRKKYLHLAKGYVGSNSRLSTMIGEQVIQSLNFAYHSRRLKKRDFRQFWIYRINSVIQRYNNKYSMFIGNLKRNNIFIDRKHLAWLAFHDLPVFKKILRLTTI